ncbi:MULTISPECIES: hypothetical protein [unclassified Bradyrhizobium]
MKNLLAPAAILVAIWAGAAAAQSAVGGPKKPSNLGGPTVQKNPVVRTTPSAVPTPPASPPKQPRKK